jgi:SMI1 / KNR4
MEQIHQVEKFSNNKIMFDFLKKYIIKNEGEKLKHSFYKLDEQEISRIEKEIFIPKELKQFYSEIGYGYMYDTPESFSVDRFLSPDEYLKINLRIDYYEFYPALNFYNTDFSKIILSFLKWLREIIS